MGWIRSAAGWALFGGAGGAVLALINDTSDPVGFVIVVVVLCGILGLFFELRDRINDEEDQDLEKAVRSPASTDTASDWLDRLGTGGRVRLRRARATLTPEGIEWTGLRKASVRWCDVEHIAPWTMSARGIRSARGVRLRASGKPILLICSKQSLPDVLATCTAMTAQAHDRARLTDQRKHPPS